MKTQFFIQWIADLLLFVIPKEIIFIAASRYASGRRIFQTGQAASDGRQCLDGRQRLDGVWEDAA